MRKFLSVVIPRYKETEKNVFPLLSSINGQVGIDFSDVEVVIANDGSEELDRDFTALFQPEIRQVCLSENGGPGVARQAGLDAAQGQYVLFCDADDTLHNVGVLGAFMQEAEKSAPDILTSSWLEELQDEKGKYLYLTHENEYTWMHGKVLRRAFLTENNIRFHPKLRIHEDSYFLAIAAELTERRATLPMLSYVWKFRPDSITRRNNGAYTYEGFPTFIRACTMADKEVEKRNPGHLEYKIVQFTLYNYFSLHLPGWLEHDELRKKSEETFVECIAPFWEYWENAKSIADVYQQERNRVFKGGIEQETLDMWLARLGLGGNV